MGLTRSGNSSSSSGKNEIILFVCINIYCLRVCVVLALLCFQLSEVGILKRIHDKVVGAVAYPNKSGIAPKKGGYLKGGI